MSVASSRTLASCCRPLRLIEDKSGTNPLQTKSEAGSLQLKTIVAKATFDESGLRLAPVCDIQVHVAGPDSPGGPDP